MKSILLLFLVFLTAKCSEQPATNETGPTQREVNRGMEEVNRNFVRDEERMIASYIERREWQTIATGTGVHYYIYEQGSGETASEGQFAKVNYEVSLLNGEVVYSSDESGPKEFLIGQDNVESGLHEAIQFMKVGDRAKIILSSHRAHGLTGDNNKIPPRSSVVYDLHLLALRDR